MSSSCAPPTQCDVLTCHVSCSHPPQAWDSHRVVVGVCQEVQLFLGSSYDFVRFLCYLFDIFVTMSIQHCFSLGNAAHPPTFPKKTHMLLSSRFMHTRIQRQKSTPTHLLHSRPQPSILYTPATHSFKPHTPTNPSQFLQIPTGTIHPLGNIHSATFLKTYTISISTHETDQKKRGQS